MSEEEGEKGTGVYLETNGRLVDVIEDDPTLVSLGSKERLQGVLELLLSGGVDLEKGEKA